MSVLQKRRNSLIGAESNEQGKSFEQKFCAYMKSNLGYRHAKIRADMFSNINSKGIQIDVVAEKASTKRLLFWLAFVIFSFVALILVYLADTMNSDVAIYLCSGMSAFLAVLMFYLTVITEIENAWVECKSSKKEKTPLEDIQTMLSRFEAYKQTERKEFNFTVAYFVSASGFTDDAYHFAKSKGVICYIEKNGKFEAATYWNI